jgi:hypothetical protein
VNWLDLLEEAEERKNTYDTPPSVGGVAENAPGSGVAKRVKRASSGPITACEEVLEMTHGYFGAEEEPVSLPAPPDHDSLVHRGTDKGRFFRGDWRQSSQ